MSEQSKERSMKNPYDQGEPMTSPNNIRVAPTVEVHGQTKVDLGTIGIDKIEFQNTGDGRFIDMIVRTKIAGTESGAHPGECLAIHAPRNVVERLREALENVPEPEPWGLLHGG